MDTRKRLQDYIDERNRQKRAEAVTSCIARLIAVGFKIGLLAYVLSFLLPDLSTKQAIGIAIALYIAIGKRGV